MSGIKGLDSHSYVSVIGCALEYRYIEVMHSSFQILIAVSTLLSPPEQLLRRCPLSFPGTEAGLHFASQFVSSDCKGLWKCSYLFVHGFL